VKKQTIWERERIVQIVPTVTVLRKTVDKNRQMQQTKVKMWITLSVPDEKFLINVALLVRMSQVSKNVLLSGVAFIFDLARLASFCNRLVKNAKITCFYRLNSTKPGAIVVNT
jgi:hypothetical protein